LTISNITKSIAQTTNQPINKSIAKKLSKELSKKLNSTAMAAIAATIATRVKELMAKMPDTLNSKKDIDEYYNKVVKEAKEAINEEKKANLGGKAPRKALGVKPPKAAKAANAEPKKRVKKANVDADGNDIEKVKKPPNAYQKFIQDNRAKVKEENPTMTGVEIFTLIAQKWNEHKKAMNVEEDKDIDRKSSASSSSGISSARSASYPKKDSIDDDEITADEEDKKKAAALAAAKAAKAANAVANAVAKTAKKGKKDESS